MYVLFTPQLIRLVADDPSVYENSLAYFKGLRFYPLVDMFDTFMFTYVLYRGGYIQFYTALFLRIGANAALSWFLGSHMGLFGVGIASVISLAVALLVKCTFLLTKKHGLTFRWYLNVREVANVTRIGFPESMLTVFIVLLEVAINNFTLRAYSAAGVAAVAVVINVFEFTIYLGEGISEYEIVAVNDSIGKESSERMDHAIRITKRAALLGGAALIAVILLTSGILPAAFDIDDEETARQASRMLMIVAPTAIFMFYTRITAIFYEYTRRISRTIILFGMAVTLFPASLAMLFGRGAIEGIAVGMAAGPVIAILLMFLYVRLVKKEKLFDYTLMHLK